jgi:hypothetical protein
MEFSISHEFATTPERFWQMFFDEEYNRGLYVALQIDREVVERREDDRTLVLHCKQQPQKELPELLKKVTPDVSYLERSTFDKARQVLDVVIEPQSGGDRFGLKGVYEVIPAGPGSVRRTFRGTVTIKVPLVGGTIERMVVGQLQDSYETATRFTRQWLQR